MSINYVKLNDSATVGSTQEEEIVPGERIIEPRLNKSVPKVREGEQLAAGWPGWLVAAGTEAIDGWLPRKLESFHMLDKVGDGTYSTVYKARDLELNKVVALKRLKFDKVEFMMKEINILRRLDHPNVIKLEGLVITSSNMFGCLYLIFEYMEHDLKGLLSLPGVTFSESQIKCYLKQLLDGINHVHSRGILHRDITTSNLLVDNHGILKIADFGLSTFFTSKATVPLTSRVGTLWYRPPELLIGSRFCGIEVDLWSVGCVLGELFNGKAILQGNNEIDQLHTIFKLCGSPSDDYWRKYNSSNIAVLKQKVPYIPQIEETFRDLPVAALELMKTLLSIEPQCRGTAAAAMDYDFFYVEPLASDPSSLPNYPPTKGLDAEWKKAKAKAESTCFDETNWIDEQDDLIEYAPWATREKRHIYKMSESQTSSEEEPNKDKGQEQQEHKFWSFIKGKKKHNHVLSTVAPLELINSHDIMGKKLPVASNHNDRQFKGKKSNLPAESNSMNVDRLLREHDRHIQEVVERAMLEKKMRAKVQA